MKFFLLLTTIPFIYAFGAGNVPSWGPLEGKSVRHGDIDDELLKISRGARMGGNFRPQDVRKIYFGSWMRDFSQAIDTAALKLLDEEAIRALISVLGFMKFGYGSGSYEVTKHRLGCYRADEHLDNPRGYPADAQKYSQCLRGPVDPREYSVSKYGIKHYLHTAREQDIPKLVRYIIDLYRDGEVDEAYIELGKLLHLLEDLFAHSNMAELALREYGYDVFPFVNRNSHVRLPNGVNAYPLVTGTFGSADFMVSVLKEIQDTISQSVTWHIDNNGYREFADNRDKQRAQAQQVLKTLFYVHDTIKRPFSAVAHKMGLASAVEWTMEKITLFAINTLRPVLEPFVASIVKVLESQVGTILKSEGQSEIFTTSGFTDPSHSQLSKDHLDHHLNPLAGRMAKAMVKILVPKIVRAWKSGNHNEIEDAVNAAKSFIFHPASLNVNPNGRRDNEAPSQGQSQSGGFFSGGMFGRRGQPDTYQPQQQQQPHAQAPQVYVPNQQPQGYPPQYQQGPYVPHSSGTAPYQPFYPGGNPNLRKRGWFDEESETDASRGFFKPSSSDSSSDTPVQQIPMILMNIVKQWALDNQQTVHKLTEKDWITHGGYNLQNGREYFASRGRDVDF